MFSLAQISFLLIALDSVALITIVFRRYLNPKKWARWSVEVSLGYYYIYLVSMFAIVTIGFFSNLFPYVFALALLVIIMIIVNKPIFSFDSEGAIPFVLYSISVFHEMYYASNIPLNSLALLGVWNLVSYPIMIFSTIILAWFMDLLFRNTSKEHLEIIRSEYGKNAPYNLNFKDGRAAIKFISTSPSVFTAFILVYSIVTICKYLIIGFPI